MTPQEEKNAELLRKVEIAAGQVKLICGVANNAAWAVVCDAMGHIRRHPSYKREVRHAFLEIIGAFKTYEVNLIYPVSDVRFFNINDMPPETRKKYGNITCRDYYEMWAGVGCAAYKETRPLITSLQNKFRLSLQKHNVPHPDIIGWAMTAETCLALAVVMYGSVMEDIETQIPNREQQLRSVFAPFSLEHIADLWQKAILLLCPDADGYVLEDGERRNIELGVEQLQQAWDNADTIYRSTATAVERYDEIFRTNGEMNKTLREISEQHAAALEAMKKDRLQNLKHQTQK